MWINLTGLWISLKKQMRLSKKSSIIKLSSASVQPHGSGRPSPKSPSRYAVAAFLEMGTLKALLLAGQGRLSGRVGMRLKPKNILRPVTFATASFDY